MKKILFVVGKPYAVLFINRVNERKKMLTLDIKQIEVLRGIWTI